MQLRPDTAQFLTDLERYAGRSFVYRNEIGVLLDLARSENKMQLFEDAVFFAKFLSKSFDLMKRIGPDGEGYDKVAVEFQSGMEKAGTLIRTIVKESPTDLKENFLNGFFRLNQESLSAMMQLLRELAWVKNWTVDGKPLP
ncbi:MAG: hypothetical protein HYW57_08110 [Ignavibacteriales bacterium]|nr:hypothetical protein [Ignavibacteriales bacterium]